jgi:hypothetical protein
LHHSAQHNGIEALVHRAKVTLDSALLHRGYTPFNGK